MNWGGLSCFGWTRSALSSECSSAREQIEDENDHCKDKKDVNPAAQCVTANESYDPEDEKNNCDSPKHFRSPRRCRLNFSGSRVMYPELVPFFW
jgi:hypothetical protein